MTGHERAMRGGNNLCDRAARFAYFTLSTVLEPIELPLLLILLILLEHEHERCPAIYPSADSSGTEACVRACAQIVRVRLT